MQGNLNFWGGIKHLISDFAYKMHTYGKRKRVKKAISSEGIIFSILFVAFFYFMGSKMGATNMFNTIMKTAHQLLLNTVFFIVAIAVIAGAIGALLSEFGVISIINKILSPFMKPLFDLPGAAVLGIITTYLSDNPAIIALANDKGFKRYFKISDTGSYKLGHCLWNGLDCYYIYDGTKVCIR